MKHIKLPTQEELRKIFIYNPDTGVLSRRFAICNHTKVGSYPKYKDKDGYFQTGINYKVYRTHRVIYKWWYGDFDESKQIDHIDRDTSNNRIKNLRLATQEINAKNRKISTRNSSGCPGVDFKCGKWRARVSVNKERIELGYFETKEEACLARKQAEKAYGYL